MACDQCQSRISDADICMTNTGSTSYGQYSPSSCCSSSPRNCISSSPSSCCSYSPPSVSALCSKSPSLSSQDGDDESERGQTPSRDEEVEYTVTLDMSLDSYIGLRLNNDTLVVEHVVLEHAVGRWNAEHPDAMVKCGHRLVEINGLPASKENLISAVESSDVLEIVMARRRELSVRELEIQTNKFLAEEANPFHLPAYDSSDDFLDDFGPCLSDMSLSSVRMGACALRSDDSPAAIGLTVSDVVESILSTSVGDVMNVIQSWRYAEEPEERKQNDELELPIRRHSVYLVDTLSPR